MDRNQAKVLLPTIQAYAEGKTIQVIDTTDQCGTWKDVSDFKINTDFKLYRIKSETTYRPFKNAEGCWEEMMKHQPFGWIKCKEGYFNIVYVDDYYVGLADKDNSSILLATKNSYQDNTFVDGTTFGVKIEEE